MNAEKQKRYKERNKNISKRKISWERKVTENLKNTSHYFMKQRLKKNLPNKKAKKTYQSRWNWWLVLHLLAVLIEVKQNLPRDIVQKRQSSKLYFRNHKASRRKMRLLSTWSNIYEPRSKVKSRNKTIHNDIKEKLVKVSILQQYHFHPSRSW